MSLVWKIPITSFTRFAKSQNYNQIFKIKLTFVSPEEIRFFEISTISKLNPASFLPTSTSTSTQNQVFLNTNTHKKFGLFLMKKGYM